MDDNIRDIGEVEQFDEFGDPIDPILNPKKKKIGDDDEDEADLDHLDDDFDEAEMEALGFGGDFE